MSEAHSLRQSLGILPLNSSQMVPHPGPFVFCLREALGKVGVSGRDFGCQL